MGTNTHNMGKGQGCKVRDALNEEEVIFCRGCFCCIDGMLCTECIGCMGDSEVLCCRHQFCCKTGAEILCCTAEEDGCCHKLAELGAHDSSQHDCDDGAGKV